MIAVFAMIVVLAAVDLLADLAEGTTAGHVLVEGFVIVVALVGLGTMARRLARLRKRAGRLHREARDLSRALRASQEEAARWRDEAHDLLRGLGEAIDRQFARWELTPAEKEVALLLLKGLSHKHIASVREVSQATARQQAGAVYKKAGVAGRHDLSAFFLEDLLLPGPDATGDPPGAG
jgi:DNA-binding CsgD family transcriptional regulator